LDSSKRSESDLMCHRRARPRSSLSELLSAPRTSKRLSQGKCCPSPLRGSASIPYLRCIEGPVTNGAPVSGIHKPRGSNGDDLLTLQNNHDIGFLLSKGIDQEEEIDVCIRMPLQSFPSGPEALHRLCISQDPQRQLTRCNRLEIFSRLGCRIHSRGSKPYFQPSRLREHAARSGPSER